MKVLVTGRLPEQVLSLIRKEHDLTAHASDVPMDRRELLALVGDVDGLLCMITDRVDEELLAAGRNLKMIANMAVGFDNINVGAATARGIWVSNTPGVLNDATADLTFALILAVSRRVIESDAITRSGRFKPWAPFSFLGTDVTGKTLGIIGLGNIGKEVARRAHGFRMPVLYHNRRRLDPVAEQDIGVRFSDLDALLSESDYVSLHVPLTDQTRRLITGRELKLMRRTAYLINVSRGPVVDEAALVQALQSGWIAGAGLDVYENEPSLASGLAQLPNVVLLPHIGSATLETRTQMAALAAENLLAGLRGETPPNCLNCPRTLA